MEKINKKIIRDEKTNRELWEIGFDDCDCVAPYVYFQAFSQDEKYIVFASNKTGVSELYGMELEGNEVVKITENFGKIYNYTFCDREIILVDEEVVSIDIETLRKRIVIKKKKEWINIFGGPAISEKNKNIACFYRDREGNIGIVYTSIKNPEIYKTYKLPESVKDVSHLIACPSEELIFTFNILPDKQNDFQLPHSERARAWMINIDKEEFKPFLIMPVGFRATHEYWGHRDNLRLYFHKKTVPSFTPVCICSINISGSDYKEHFYSENRKLGHSSISYDNKFIVSDVQEVDENELYLINLETGKFEILCWPNSSCSEAKGQLSHVHPSFSPSNKYIIFSSDKKGKTSVYIMPLSFSL